MDPNLFHLDYEKLFESLLVIIVVSFFVERALSLLFENRFYLKFVQDKGLRGIKEVIAFSVSFLICVKWDFDVLSIVIGNDKTTYIGMAISAAVIAGGSKASIKLFHDILKTSSKGYQEKKGALADMKK